MKSHSCVAFEMKSNTSTTKSTTISTSTQPTIDKIVLIRKTLTTGQSNVIKDLIVRWVCGDIRPLSIIDDSGLRVLIQECVKFGSLHGNIDVNDLLRSRTTISNHIQSFAETCRERMKQLLKEPYTNGCLTISPDLWSDKYK
ncbi:unnamed protein product [Rotaria sp. Silwood2]|nr:unnamed protein product [Rotaria sp. Silwood2]